MLFFYFYTLCFFLFFYFFVVRQRKKITVLFSFSIFNIFYSPVAYYFGGGEAYSNFDFDVLDYYMAYALCIIFLFLMSYIFTCIVKFKQREIYLSNSISSKTYFFCFILTLITYYLYFFKSFPLIHFIMNDELIERPDLTGNIPFFYTASTIVSVILPSAYFYFFDDIKSRWYHLLINVFIVFFFVASGHKGLIVYYFLFIWIYVMNYRVNLSLLVIICIIFLNYLIAKGIVEFNNDTFQYLLNSPFRRFFVTQGAGYIHRMDMLLNEAYNYINANPRGIKFDVFEHMYGVGLIGSAPTFFTGDFLIKYGFIASLIIFFIVTTCILLCAKWLTLTEMNRKYFVYWNFYFVLYLICMAEISFASSMRMLFAVLNVVLIYILCRKKRFVREG